MAVTGAAEYESSLAVRDGALEIYMQGRSLDDAHAEKWCAWAREHVASFLRKNAIQRQANGFAPAREVNFSNNSLGDKGVHAVLRVLFNLRIGVRVLKLFKNNLGRAAASALMDWLVVTPIAAYELHLSHNFIPREGAVDILKAVAYNTAYPPEKPGRGKIPLWLRLEQNIVTNPDDLIATAENQMRKIRAVGGSTLTDGVMLCYLRDPNRHVCRSDFCEHSRGDHVPLAQVTYLVNQRDSRMRVPTEAQSWHSGRDQREETSRWRIAAPLVSPIGPVSQRRNGDASCTVHAKAWGIELLGGFSRPADSPWHPGDLPPPLSPPILDTSPPPLPVGSAPAVKPPPASRGTKAPPPACPPAAVDGEATRVIGVPPEVKPPPPGFPDPFLPPAKGPPAERCSPALPCEFKAPPLAFKASPVGFEVAPAKPPPAAKGIGDEPEDGEGVMARAMREAPIKAPPAKGPPAAIGEATALRGAAALNGCKSPPATPPRGLKDAMLGRVPPLVEADPPFTNSFLPLGIGIIDVDSSCPNGSTVPQGFNEPAREPPSEAPPQPPEVSMSPRAESPPPLCSPPLPHMLWKPQILKRGGPLVPSEIGGGQLVPNLPSQMFGVDSRDLCSPRAPSPDDDPPVDLVLRRRHGLPPSDAAPRPPKEGEVNFSATDMLKEALGPLGDDPVHTVDLTGEAPPRAELPAPPELPGDRLPISVGLGIVGVDPHQLGQHAPQGPPGTWDTSQPPSSASPAATLGLLGPPLLQANAGPQADGLPTPGLMAPGLMTGQGLMAPWEQATNMITAPVVSTQATWDQPSLPGLQGLGPACAPQARWDAPPAVSVSAPGPCHPVMEPLTSGLRADAPAFRPAPGAGHSSHGSHNSHDLMGAHCSRGSHVVSSFRPLPTLAPWEHAPSPSDFCTASSVHPPPGPALGGASGNLFGSGHIGHPLRSLAGEAPAVEAAAKDARGCIMASRLASSSSASRSSSESSASSKGAVHVSEPSMPMQALAAASAIQAGKEMSSDRDTSSEGERDETAPFSMQETPATTAFLGAADFLGSEPRSPDLIVSPDPPAAEQESDVHPERLGPDQPSHVLWKEILRQRQEIFELQAQLQAKDEELRHCRTWTKISATSNNFLI